MSRSRASSTARAATASASAARPRPAAPSPAAASRGRRGRSASRRRSRPPRPRASGTPPRDRPPTGAAARARGRPRAGTAPRPRPPAAAAPARAPPARPPRRRAAPSASASALRPIPIRRWSASGAAVATDRSASSRARREIARQPRAAGPERQRRRAHAALPARHQRLGGLAQQRHRLRVLVAQVAEDPAQRPPRVDDEPRARRRQPLRLERRLARSVDVGVEAPDRREREAERQQRLVAVLARELRRPARRVELDVQRPRGIGHQRHPDEQPRLQHRPLLRRPRDRAPQHVHALAALPQQVPQPRQLGGELARPRRVVGLEPVLDRRAQVVVVARERRPPAVLVALELRRQLAHAREPVVEVAVGRPRPARPPRAGDRRRTGGSSPAAGSARRSADHERLVDEPRERAHDVVLRAHRPRRVEVEAADEHREPAEHGAVDLVEQLVAPRHRREQARVPRHGVARAAHEQREAVVEPGLDLARRERPRPRGGELERERRPVEPRAHRDDRAVGLLVERQVGLQLRRPLEEQRPRVLRRQRRQPPHRLVGQPERLAAGGDDRHLRARAQAVGDLGGRVEHVLAVVEAQQQPPPRELRAQRGRLAARRVDEHAGAPPPPRRRPAAGPRAPRARPTTRRRASGRPAPPRAGPAAASCRSRPGRRSSAAACRPDGRAARRAPPRARRTSSAGSGGCSASRRASAAAARRPARTPAAAARGRAAGAGRGRAAPGDPPRPPRRRASARGWRSRAAAACGHARPPAAPRRCGPRAGRPGRCAARPPPPPAPRRRPGRRSRRRRSPGTWPRSPAGS